MKLGSYLFDREDHIYFLKGRFILIAFADSMIVFCNISKRKSESYLDGYTFFCLQKRREQSCIFVHLLRLELRLSEKLKGMKY